MNASTTITFEVEARRVLQELRSAFSGLIADLGSKHSPNKIRRAADLSRALGVNRMLAWQIHRVAASPNPLAAGTDVPGTAAVEQVLRAARSAGASEESVSRAKKAMLTFESLVEHHAGNRAAFATMIKSLAGSEADHIDVKIRRQAYRANSQIWGCQVRTQISCVLQHPGRTPSLVDFASLRGWHDICRLRTGAPFPLARQRLLDSHGEVVTSHTLADRSNNSPLGRGLLLEYCTQPCPSLETRVQDGFVDTYLSDTPLGNVGAQTLYVAGNSRDVEWGESGDEPNRYKNRILVTKPTDTLIVDVLFRHGMFGRLDPSVAVLGSLHPPATANPAILRPEDALPMRVQVHNLGVGLGVLPMAHAPQYVDVVKSVCHRLGWNADDFEVFRCVVDYPLLNSVVSMTFDLPEKGDW